MLQFHFDYQISTNQFITYAAKGSTSPNTFGFWWQLPVWIHLDFFLSNRPGYKPEMQYKARLN